MPVRYPTYPLACRPNSVIRWLCAWPGYLYDVVHRIRRCYPIFFHSNARQKSTATRRSVTPCASIITRFDNFDTYANKEKPDSARHRRTANYLAHTVIYKVSPATSATEPPAQADALHSQFPQETPNHPACNDTTPRWVRLKSP